MDNQNSMMLSWIIGLVRESGDHMDGLKWAMQKSIQLLLYRTLSRMKCLYIDHLAVLSFQTAQDNIDLQTTILSRFDLIFIVKDIRMYGQDKV